MTRLSMVAFGGTMFVLGAGLPVAVDAQRQPQHIPDTYAEPIAIPVTPRVGTVVVFLSPSGTNDRCDVKAVSREWVLCGASGYWRNLYNGQGYSLPNE